MKELLNKAYPKADKKPSKGNVFSEFDIYGRVCRGKVGNLAGVLLILGKQKTLN